MTYRRGWEQSHKEHFPKILIRPLPVQDRKDNGSRYLLSQAPAHVDAQDGEATMAAQQREEEKLN